MNSRQFTQIHETIGNPSGIWLNGGKPSHHQSNRSAEYMFPIPSQLPTSFKPRIQPSTFPLGVLALEFKVNKILLGSLILKDVSIRIYQTNADDEWYVTKEGEKIGIIKGSNISSIIVCSTSNCNLILREPCNFKHNNFTSSTDKIQYFIEDETTFRKSTSSIKEIYPTSFHYGSAALKSREIPKQNVRLEGLQPQRKPGFGKRPRPEEPTNRVRRIRTSNSQSEDVGEKISRSAKSTNWYTEKVAPGRAPGNSNVLIGTPFFSEPNRVITPGKELSPGQPMIDAATGIRNVQLNGSLRTNLFNNKPVEAKIHKPLSPPPIRINPVLRKYAGSFMTPYRFIFKDTKGLDVTPDDAKRLEEGEFLNDTLINFYLKYFHQVMSEQYKEVGNSIHIFNSFFYEKLSPKKQEDEVSIYSRVKNWTSKVDLFKMKYVIMPINAKLHWYLVIIFNLPALLRNKSDDDDDDDDDSEFSETPIQDNCTIFILDSLRTKNYAVVSRKLEDYIYEEASDKLNVIIDKKRIVTKLVEVPQQRNFCDCGVYVIHYVHRFMSDPEKIVKLMANDAMNGKPIWYSLWQPNQLNYKRLMLMGRIIEFRKENEISQLEEKAKAPPKLEELASEDTEMEIECHEAHEPSVISTHVEDVLDKAIQRLENSLDGDGIMMDVEKSNSGEAGANSEVESGDGGSLSEQGGGDVGLVDITAEETETNGVLDREVKDEGRHGEEEGHVEDGNVEGGDVEEGKGENGKGEKGNESGHVNDKRNVYKHDYDSIENDDNESDTIENISADEEVDEVEDDEVIASSSSPSGAPSLADEEDGGGDNKDPMVIVDEESDEDEIEVTKMEETVQKKNVRSRKLRRARG